MSTWCKRSSNEAYTDRIHEYDISSLPEEDEVHL